MLSDCWHSAATHLSYEDPDQPETPGEKAQDDVDDEVDEAISLAGHLDPF